MNFLIMGSGAIGGYIGARLIEANHKVVFIARGLQLEALEKNGLQINSEIGNLVLKNIVASADPGNFVAPDVIIFCVKLPDTQKAAEACLPIIGDQTSVLTLQNGVESSSELAKFFGEKAVLGGTIYIACHLSKPGLVQHFGQKSHIIFGEHFKSKSKRLEQIQSAFSKTSLKATISNDIETEIWKKFIGLVALSGVTTISRLPIRTLLANPHSASLIENLMRETLLLARAMGINLSEAVIDNHKQFFKSVSPQMTSSMFQDLNDGRRLELEWLSGGVVRMSKKLGLSAPKNETIYAALKLYENGAPKLVS